MQTTTFTAYALKAVLFERNTVGSNVAGYTVKPGSGFNGLLITGRNRPRGQYVGFTSI